MSTPRSLTERAFRRGDVPAVRLFTRAFGARAAIAPGRMSDFVLAVSEATACATARGSRAARVRLWMSGQRAYCEVRGGGLLSRRPPGDHPARPAELGEPHGEEEALRHWVLKQLADYVSVASAPDGVCVLLSMTVA
jgi:hypothetical protein